MLAFISLAGQNGALWQCCSHGGPGRVQDGQKSGAVAKPGIAGIERQTQSRGEPDRAIPAPSKGKLWRDSYELLRAFRPSP